MRTRDPETVAIACPNLSGIFTIGNLERSTLTHELRGTYCTSSPVMECKYEVSSLIPASCGFEVASMEGILEMVPVDERTSACVYAFLSPEPVAFSNKEEVRAKWAHTYTLRTNARTQIDTHTSEIISRMHVALRTHEHDKSTSAEGGEGRRSLAGAW